MSTHKVFIPIIHHTCWEREMADKPHAVCAPFPDQGHINPMLKLAKILLFNGFHITFVNTEYNHTLTHV
jgi:hypothetical protein